MGSALILAQAVNHESPEPASPDGLAQVVGAFVLIVVVIVVAYAVYLWLQPSPRPNSKSQATVMELERALAAAKKACVDGPPQGPSCVEAARVTTDLAKARGTP